MRMLFSRSRRVRRPQSRSVALATWTRSVALAVLACVSVGVSAETFEITDIRVQGLQRISAGTVFNVMPVNVGDRVDEQSIRQLIRVLFQSGYFSDIRMARDGGVLVVAVVERPAVDTIDIEGNKAIPTEALLEGLSSQGLAVGEIFKRAVLERMRSELQRQYVAQGKYSAEIETSVEELPRNRVAISVNVIEGKNALIRHLNIVGNEVFSDQELLELMELRTPNLFSFYTGTDKYSREKLGGDLEKLESYYKDRGYVDFKVESTQVSVTPDRREVYIAINVSEGDRYTVTDVDLIGELNDVPADALRALILVRPEQTFSRALVTATEERLTQALGNNGYTFASATGVPQVGDKGEVAVKFFVDSGKRAYVRRINFRGNTVTQDEVLRREMRQLEAGWASTAQIDLSRVRLERLGYFREVEVETPEVPGTEDQIDVDFTIEEQPSGSISATLGFQQGTGLLLGASYQQNNWLGSGNSLSLGINYSIFQKSLSFNYFYPYFTIDGVSRGFSLFYRKTDFDERNIARFTTDSIGGAMNFSIPLGETQRFGFGIGFDFTDITEGRFPAREISEFIDKEGDKSLNYKLTANYSNSTLNRGLFATAGLSHQLGLELSVPGSDVQFYRLQYNAQAFVPVPRFSELTFRLRTELGFADSYGSTNVVPFYEHFFSGGFGSVRGFEQNTLGPRSTPALTDPFSDGDEPFGGNLKVVGSVELLFPLPFVEDRRSFRPALFFDVGNVFNTNCPEASQGRCFDFDVDELRYSVGFGMTWLSGFGPLTFAISKPLNAGPFDEEESFQFELGQTF